MMTVDPITQQSNLPLVAIKPLEEVREEHVGSPQMKRQRVEVELEFRTKEIAETLAFKDGSNRMTNTVWKSFIHVEDAKTCQTCLNWKYKKTKKAWRPN